MKQILHETQTLGPIYTYMQYEAYSKIFIEVCENYQKKTVRNRYQLMTTNGVITLSIPLKKGKNNQMPVSEVQIAYDESWHLQQLHTIRSAYGKSAYFEYYFPELEDIFMAEEKYLVTFNNRLLSSMLKNLKLTVPIDMTSSYIHPEDIDLYTADFRNQKSPDYIQYQPYIQVWSDRFNFAPNLSILDLLFCTGPEANSILNKTRTFNNNLINQLD